ncbi:MAG TPA: hypothetical protein VFE91_05500 [Nitrososphaerales archaeon]|nr:hypothetical protein [Nitrososphaerales archaeon]
MVDGETTTYNRVRMDWALEGPEDFRRGLIQGIAESDASVNVSGQEVEFWIGPSWDLASGLLSSFGISSFRNREALAISKSQVKKAFMVPILAPHLQTYRYQKLSKLATAEHITRGTRLPQHLREEIRLGALRGLSVPAISELLVDKFGVILTFEAVQRWAMPGVKSVNEPV